MRKMIQRLLQLRDFHDFVIRHLKSGRCVTYHTRDLYIDERPDRISSPDSRGSGFHRLGLSRPSYEYPKVLGLNIPTCAIREEYAMSLLSRKQKSPSAVAIARTAFPSGRQNRHLYVGSMTA